MDRFIDSQAEIEKYIKETLKSNMDRFIVKPGIEGLFGFVSFKIQYG